MGILAIMSLLGGMIFSLMNERFGWAAFYFVVFLVTLTVVVFGGG